MEEVFNISLIVDITAIAIIVICALVYASSGFLSAVVDLVGTFVSLVLSFLASRFLSSWVFEAFIRAGMHRNIMDVLNKNGVTDIMEGIREVLSFLPEGIIQLMAEDVTPALNASADAMATQIINQVVVPVIVPMIMFVFFVMFFVISMVLARSLSKTLKKAKKLPVIGQANTILGAITGIVIGVLFAVVMGFFFWALAATNGQPMLSGLNFGDSFLYKIVSTVPWLALADEALSAFCLPIVHK